MSVAPGAVNPINAQSLADALPHLRRPFAPAAVKYKIQTNPKTPDGNALIVAFIDARLVGERLNYVCPDDWEHEFVAVPGGLECRLTVFGKTRSDVGYWADTNNEIGFKGLRSDAFKRAAVHFGIGVSIYALPQTRLKAPEIKQLGKNWYIQRAGEAKLKKTYEDFLAGKGSQFGEPLDHGDSWDSQGGEETLVTREETASQADPGPGAPKQEAPKQEEQPAADRKVNAEAVPAIIEKFVASGKTSDDLRMWAVAKGVELQLGDDVSMETTFGSLTANQAKELVKWLKR